MAIFALAIAWKKDALSPSAIDSRTFRWAYFGAIAFITLAVDLLAPHIATRWIAAGYALAFALVLPLRFGMVSFCAFVATAVFLSAVSNVKQVVSGMPITMFDLQVAFQNPDGLMQALGLPSRTIFVIISVAVFAVAAMLGAGALDVRRARRPIRLNSRDARLRVAAVAVLAVAGFRHLYATSRYLESHDDFWATTGISYLSHEVGIVAFLFHSARLESNNAGPIFEVSSEVPGPDAQEIRAAVNTYVRFDTSTSNGAEQRPNIIVVLTESTFDPGKTFRLNGKWDERLFTANAATRLYSELRVNTKGGGTWISEFESIVGLDSRLFGYFGYYTHAGVSPFITGSLATHLRARGYRAMAFFPHPRNLFSAQPAYDRYGFEKVYDGPELWNTQEWVRDDRGIASTVRDHLQDEDDAPFFAYVKLVENHSPHSCDKSAPPKFTAVFAGPADSATNCALNEYLRRMVASADAIDTLRAFMIELERRTGRPYVLLNFGDHQPHIFTGTVRTSVPVGPFRTDRDPYTTYVHLESSLETDIDCCTTPLPIAAIPTILSAFAADDVDDIYLGENLWLYAQCGSDALRAASDTSNTSSGTCARAFERAVAAFSRSDILRLH